MVHPEQDGSIWPPDVCCISRRLVSEGRHAERDPSRCHIAIKVLAGNV